MYNYEKKPAIICFVLSQGKVKAMVENRGEIQLDPTPNFDCHVSKTANVDVLVTGPLNAYEATQVRFTCCIQKYG